MIEARFGEMKSRSVFVDYVQTAGAADDVADGDTTKTSGAGAGDSGKKVKLTFEYQIARKHEQSFVGNR